MIVKATTTKDLRQNFNKYADNVSEYGETILVTRPNRKNIVLISEEEYNSWQETNYLMSTDANKKVLLEGIQATGSGKTLTPAEWDQLHENNE